MRIFPKIYTPAGPFPYVWTLQHGWPRQNVKTKFYGKIIGKIIFFRCIIILSNFRLHWIFNNYWTRLSNLWFVSGEQIKWSICETLANHHIFAISKFNICFMIRSPSLFSYSNYLLTVQGRDLPLRMNRIFNISRQLFAGYVVSSWPTKRNWKMHRMIGNDIYKFKF